MSESTITMMAESGMPANPYHYWTRNPACAGRIFPRTMQALLNLIDRGMSLQEAGEQPRVWTEGNALKVEQTVPEIVRAKG